VDGVHCFSAWCKCISLEEQLATHKKTGWKINEDQLKLMYGEKIDIDLVDNYIDWARFKVK